MKEPQLDRDRLSDQSLNADRWEHGSEFGWADSLEGERAVPVPGCYTYATGRDALRDLLRHGMQRFGWRRLWLPSYFCQDVVAAMASTGIACRPYADRPDKAWSGPTARSVRGRDVLFVVNYFGLRNGTNWKPLKDRGAWVIEDHTHDPWSNWSAASTADFCCASLRKTLPLPDGALLWSPAAHHLPVARRVTRVRERAASNKLAAMLLKQLYLNGSPVNKSVFRQLAITGEKELAAGPVSAMSATSRELLSIVPALSWRQRRRENFGVLSRLLRELPWLNVLMPESKSCTPFSLVFVTDTPERRKRVRSMLIERSIYPSILWQLDTTVLRGIPQEHVMLARRVLSLHCDHRYGERDLERVADALTHVGA